MVTSGGGIGGGASPGGASDAGIGGGIDGGGGGASAAPAYESPPPAISSSTRWTAADESGTLVAAWKSACRKALVFSASRPATTLLTRMSICAPSAYCVQLMIFVR